LYSLVYTWEAAYTGRERKQGSPAFSEALQFNQFRKLANNQAINFHGTEFEYYIPETKAF
jgi:hypothetical protein